MAETKRREEKKKKDDKNKEKYTLKEQENKKKDKVNYKDCVFYDGRIIEGKKDYPIDNRLLSGYNLKLNTGSSVKTANKNKRDNKVNRLPPLNVALNEDKNDNRLAQNNEAKLIHPIYEAIELQPGVEYLERGRTKKAAKSYNESIGKFSKTEYSQKYNGWCTAHNMNSLPDNFLTNTINSTSQQEYRVGTTTYEESKEISQRTQMFSQPAEQLSKRNISTTRSQYKGFSIQSQNNFDMHQLFVPTYSSNEAERNYSISPIFNAPLQAQRSSEASINSQIDRFNIQIMEDVNWGYSNDNKNLKAFKKLERPRTKDMHTVMSKLKFPRERRSIHNYTSRERLPPPSLGFTIGHGQLKSTSISNK